MKNANEPSVTFNGKFNFLLLFVAYTCPWTPVFMKFYEFPVCSSEYLKFVLVLITFEIVWETPLNLNPINNWHTMCLFGNLEFCVC